MWLGLYAMPFFIALVFFNLLVTSILDAYTVVRGRRLEEQRDFFHETLNSGLVWTMVRRPPSSASIHLATDGSPSVGVSPLGCPGLDPADEDSPRTPGVGVAVGRA